MAETARTYAQLQAILADNSTGDISPEDARDLMASICTTGWGSYADTQYTSESPFSLPANTDTALPNNKGTTIETYKPKDVTTFYDGSVITGREGDGILITVDLIVTPSGPTASSIDLWFDIGGAIGELYRRPVSFLKGSGVDNPINFTVSGYTLDTWEANGATVYARANGACTIHGIRYVISRTHRGGLS